MASLEPLLASLHARGFDNSELVRGTDGEFCVRLGCSQCQAAAICGVACHETGCPNSKRLVDKGEDDGEDDGEDQGENKDEDAGGYGGEEDDDGGEENGDVAEYGEEA